MRSRFLSVPSLMVMLGVTLLGAACTGSRSPEAPSTAKPGAGADAARSGSDARPDRRPAC